MIKEIPEEYLKRSLVGGHDYRASLSNVFVYENSNVAGGVFNFQYFGKRTVDLSFDFKIGNKVTNFENLCEEIWNHSLSESMVLDKKGIGSVVRPVFSDLLYDLNNVSL